MNAWIETLTGMRLLDPWLLLLALFVPLGLGIRHWRGRPAIRFSPGEMLRAGLPSSWRVRILPLPRWLQVLGLLLVVVTLARPVQRHPLPIQTEGIDIFLCLDASSSMSSNDLDPDRTRLDLAKEAAATFIAARPDDRIGLVRFAHYPDVVCPLTLDHRALLELLAGVELVKPEGQEDLTGIGTAVGRAAQVLRGSLADSKVVILLTDGVENVATADTPDEVGPLQAARLCEGLGVRVYTIVAGIGRQGRDGEFVPLDTTQVQRLAEITGGEFYEARDAGALASVYGYIDALEKQALREPRYETEEKFLLFLVAALLLLVCARFLQSTVLEVIP